jgi:hypothetical protein
MAASFSANPKIAKLYESVPEGSLRHLQEFRERYPYQTVTLGDRTWRYIDSGGGETALFIPAVGPQLQKYPSIQSRILHRITG